MNATTIPHFYKDVQVSQTCVDCYMFGFFVPSGYVCLTDLIKAGGKKKRINDYLDGKKTQEYLEELMAETIAAHTAENPAIDTASIPPLVISLVDEKGLIHGTWGHPEVAIDLTAWISTKFRVWANRTLRLILNKDYQALNANAHAVATKLEEETAKLWTEVRQMGKITRRTLTDTIKAYIERHPEMSENDRIWVYKNATDAMYCAVFGMEAMPLENFLGCERHQSRNYLAASSLKQIDFAEEAICRQIDHNDRHPLIHSKPLTYALTFWE